MRNKGLLSLLGGLMAALAASSCCILPLLLGAASAGSVGLGAALAPYRPYFISLTVLLLGGAFYFTYSPQKIGCEADCCDAKLIYKHRISSMLLWMVTIFTVGSLVYPNFLAYHASTTQTPVPARSIAPTTSIMVFSIDNMTCEECTLTIVKALKASPGVYDASVDFASKHSTVSFNANKISAQELRIVIEKTGFPVIDMLHSEPH